VATPHPKTGPSTCGVSETSSTISDFGRKKQSAKSPARGYATEKAQLTQRDGLGLRHFAD
jgi:hypothetical protein